MNMNHKHIVVSGQARTPMTTASEVTQWLSEIVEAVDMKIMMGPFAERCETPGNEGVTGVVVIETSHCSIHSWDNIEDPYFRFDLYSCKDFDPNVLIDFAKKFDPYYIEYMVIDRNNEIKVIDYQSMQIIPIISLLSAELQDAYREAGKVSRNGEKVTNSLQKKARAIYNALDKRFGVKNAKRNRLQHVKHAKTISSIKSRSKAKGIEFDLTADWYHQKWLEAKEKYPKLKGHNTDYTDFWTADVDRIVPDLGYTQSNCRIIPHGLNVAKFNWSPEQLEELYLLLGTELNKTN